MTFTRLVTTGEKNRSVVPKLHSGASFMLHIFFIGLKTKEKNLTPTLKIAKLV
jgi:hypothetical protein